MDVRTVDKDLLHLYPPFRAKLARVLEETGKACGEEWASVETYRSPERQLYLFAQGRERPGPIVTWLKSPGHHGAGLAADCKPIHTGYRASRKWWGIYRDCYHAHGLDNPAWLKGDLGHCQLTDPSLRARALVWVRAGFTDPAPDPPSAISVIVDGEPVPDAHAEIRDGRAYVMLRPVADGLDLVIAEVTGRGDNRIARLVSDAGEWRVAVVLKAGRGWVKATDLPAVVFYVGAEKILSIARRA